MEYKKLFLVAQKIKTLQEFYQASHMLTYGESFIGVHEMYSDFYEELSNDFDDYSENLIGNFTCERFHHNKIIEYVAKNIPPVHEFTNVEMVQKGIELEKDLIALFEEIEPKIHLSLANLVGDLATKADVRLYKLKRTNKTDKGPKCPL